MTEEDVTFLTNELISALKHYTRFDNNWDSAGGKRITTDALESAANIGKNLILELEYPVKNLNLKPVHDGGLLFTLDGPSHRSVDVWVESDGRVFVVLDPGPPHNEANMAEFELDGWNVEPVVVFIEAGVKP